MADTVKKTVAPKKPRTAAPKRAAPKTKSTSSNVTQMKVSTEEVARLAHQYWADRGYQDGHDAEDWFRAEQELFSKAS